MRPHLVILFIFVLSSIIYGQERSINCLPNKGIKTTKTTTQLDSRLAPLCEAGVDFEDKSNDSSEEHYDLEGRLTSIKNFKYNHVIREFNHIYNDGKLQLTSFTRKSLPDNYYPEEE